LEGWKIARLGISESGTLVDSLDHKVLKLNFIFRPQLFLFNQVTTKFYNPGGIKNVKPFIFSTLKPLNLDITQLFHHSKLSTNKL